MIREHIFSARTPTEPHFRWRGGDVSRIESLSDAAFAFALTWLLVANRVIESSEDLLAEDVAAALSWDKRFGTMLRLMF